MALFERYIGIDHSGAKSQDSSCKGPPGLPCRGLQHAGNPFSFYNNTVNLDTRGFGQNVRKRQESLVFVVKQRRLRHEHLAETGVPYVNAEVPQTVGVACLSLGFPPCCSLALAGSAGCFAVDESMQVRP